MKLILVAVFVSVVCGKPARDNSCDCVCGVRGRSARIVGGNATHPHEYPWLAGLWRQGKLYCGASVISSNHVLTAAHCVNNFKPSEIHVYFGGHDISVDYSDRRSVKEIHQHEYFDSVTYDNDIAVIRLDRPIDFGPKLQPACLPASQFEEYDGQLTVIAGWGRTGEKQPVAKSLRSVIVPVWSQDDCARTGYGKKRLTGNMMCAGFQEGRKDACQGDSGGPMNFEGSTGSMEVIGIVSWGRGCARPNLPGIYTRVSNYLPWIKKYMNDQCLCEPKEGQRTNFLENMVNADENDIH